METASTEKSCCSRVQVWAQAEARSWSASYTCWSWKSVCASIQVCAVRILECNKVDPWNDAHKYNGCALMTTLLRYCYWRQGALKKFCYQLHHIRFLSVNCTSLECAAPWHWGVMLSSESLLGCICTYPQMHVSAYTGWTLLSDIIYINNSHTSPKPHLQWHLVCVLSESCGLYFLFMTMKFPLGYKPKIVSHSPQVGVYYFPRKCITQYATLQLWPFSWGSLCLLSLSISSFLFSSFTFYSLPHHTPQPEFHYIAQASLKRVVSILSQLPTC